jgi:hypothetical protein
MQVSRGLCRTNPEAFKFVGKKRFDFVCLCFNYRDLLKDLIVHIKDAMEVKQEKVHRMKKQDYICFHLIHIFELLADREVFRYW